jgi:MFS transporter, ACS family, D-galactonate transporter
MLYPLTIFFWSIATLCLGLSTGLVMLIILRMTVGLFEVPSFLINNRIATTWFGERERATCIAVYTSAEFVGLAFLTPLLAWLKVTFGWPVIFFFTGALGLAWSFVFRRGAYHDPAEFPGANRPRSS